MDTRVLAAVFISLFAVAMGMQYGSLNVDGFMDSLDDFQGLTPTDVIDRGGGEEANTTVDATVSTAEPVSVTVSGTDLSLPVHPGTVATIDDFTVNGSGTVALGGFSGTVEMTPDNVTVDGSATRVATGGLSLTSDTEKAVHIVADRDTLTLGIDGRTVTFHNATGEVSYPDGGTTTTYTRPRTLAFAWFNGTVTAMGGAEYRVEGRTHGDVQD